jgi:hypothetical protein
MWRGNCEKQREERHGDESTTDEEQNTLSETP